MNKPDRPAETGLIDGRMKEGERQIAKSAVCSTSRIWMILAVVFFITSVALAAYVAYFKITEESSAVVEESKIVNKYPGYFRTPEEQAMVEQEYIEESKNATNITYAPINRNASQEQAFCRFDCGQPQRRKRSALVEYVTTVLAVHRLNRRSTSSVPKEFHGCCISTGRFISPDTAEDSNDKTVTVVQFGNRRQYFHTEKCETALGCSGCTCAQKSTYVSAVIKDGNKVMLRLIKIDGCCKCYNNL